MVKIDFKQAQTKKIIKQNNKLKSFTMMLPQETLNVLDQIVSYLNNSIQIPKDNHPITRVKLASDLLVKAIVMANQAMLTNPPRIPAIKDEVEKLIENIENNVE